MNHLPDVAKAVIAERLRQAPSAHVHRITKREGAPMSTIAVRGIQVTLLAVLVVVVALGGSATAGKLITGKQVKNGSITSLDLRDGSVSGLDVADGSLTDADLGELVQGPKGPRGPQGPRGLPGPIGSPGSSGLSYVVQSNSVPKSSTRTWSADCGAGTRAIGGGLSSSTPSSFWLSASAPEISGASWIVTAKNTRDIAQTAFAWAVCATKS